MLVKFHSSAAGKMIMFAEPAAALLRAIGKETTAQGVITCEQLPAAIAALSALIADDPPPAEAPAADAGERDEAPPLPIGLAKRALPFLELLRQTLREEGYVVWEAPAEFGEPPASP